MTVQEYLATSFEDADCEFIDGLIEETTVGEIDHAHVQGSILFWFAERRKQFGIHPLLGVRTRVSPTRFRVPDITIVRGGKPVGRIITEPPLLVIEILSTDDRASRMEAKIDDYLNFGVQYVWVIDPQTGQGHIYTAERRIAVEDGKFRAGADIEMDFAELSNE